MRKIIIAIFLTVSGAPVAGQQLETVAPATVPAGRPFNVEYRIDLSGGRIETPDFKGFTLLAGPTVSTSTNVTTINGQTTTKNSTFFEFTIVGNEAGVFTLPGATVVVAGENYTSQPRPVEVVEEAASATADASRNESELFLRAIPDRKTVWKGEPVRVYFKLYSRNPNLRREGGKMPSFNGFWLEQLDASRYESQTENYNSAVYYTFVVGDYLLFPLQSGVLKIDPMQLNLVASQVSQSRDRTMEEMLFGGPDVIETRHSVSSPVVDITVKELPAGAPAGFGGAVGNFTMTAAPPETELLANAGATYRVTISGTGNFRQISAPQVVVPASFEMLNTKTIDETRPASRGMTGSKQFEYPMIARGEGSYRIEPVKFSFFDPQRAVYKTLTASEVRLEVVADTLSGGGGAALVGGVTQRELEILNRDIRFIKHGAPALRQQGGAFALSAAWFACVVALTAISVLLYFNLRKHLSRRRDVVRMRGRRAGKVVHARLRTAGEYLRQGSDRRFHDEMLKALWGYMGDKLNIPAANLTKENIRERLLAREVPNDLIVRYIGLISDSESAQYSPSESVPMKDVYRSAAEVISKMESYFK
jgi:hypothetical protein